VFDLDRFHYSLRFHLAIVLSVLRFTDSDYPFGIFKLFFLLLESMLFHLLLITVFWFILWLTVL
jgi:hypothetical protein